MNKKRISAFWTTLVTLALVFLLIEFGIPAVSQRITGLDLPLPVPHTLFLFYAVLFFLGAFVYVTSDDATLRSFLSPIKKLVRGECGKPVRLFFFILIPLAGGFFVFQSVKPSTASPVALRVQHPSSNFPKKFESMVNPLTRPTFSDVSDFIEQVKNNSVRFFPQVQQKSGGLTNIDFIPKPAVKEFLKKLRHGIPDRELARQALLEKRLFEGRALYAINCRPCHGDSAAGDGPMAYGFGLRPINFTDNGTIEVLVEGYTFWRISIGGKGLPVESTPWDSAMPEWQTDLSEREIWTVIMGEYNLALKTPRIREKLE